MWIDLEAGRKALEEGDGAGVKVAILDSGVETSHPALQGLELDDDLAVEAQGPAVSVHEANGVDLYGHGTAIASIIRRLAPAARLGSFRVLNANLASRSHIIREGVRLAMENGYHVLNCSFGCLGTREFIMNYKAWVDQAYLGNIHIIAACNNNDVLQQEWPSWFPTVISVNMARDADPNRIYRVAGQMVEFAALGMELELPWIHGSTRSGMSGSSYAAPLASGLVARLLSKHPGLSPLAVKGLLQQIALPWDTRLAGSNVRTGPAPGVHSESGGFS